MCCVVGRGSSGIGGGAMIYAGDTAAADEDFVHGGGSVVIDSGAATHGGRGTIAAGSGASASGGSIDFRSGWGDASSWDARWAARSQASLF